MADKVDVPKEVEAVEEAVEKNKADDAIEATEEVDEASKSENGDNAENGDAEKDGADKEASKNGASKETPAADAACPIGKRKSTVDLTDGAPTEGSSPEKKAKLEESAEVAPSESNGDSESATA